MKKQAERTNEIRDYIIRLVKDGELNPSENAASVFGITKQAVNRHLSTLVGMGFLVSHGETKNRTYSLGDVRHARTIIPLERVLGEDLIYKQSFEWIVLGLPGNITDIVFYGFTEMVNNVIDHSDGKFLKIMMNRDHSYVNIFVVDDGEGIFRRIARLCNLYDEKQSILELAKGKLTTDPDNHSGQGVFFTSRMFDDFVIESKGIRFEHHSNHDFDLLNDINTGNNSLNTELDSTIVAMRIAIDSPRTDKEIFDEFSGSEDEDYAFNRTIVPVKMARFGDEQLVSRSQAKRVLSRVENFQYVVFDFDGVASIGQAFADQIFRVYVNANPRISITYENATDSVVNMINRAKVT